jgi:lysyl-tRNA synthetase class 1
MFQGYGWLGIRGLGNMHSSTGNNITPSKVLEVYEPDIIKWLFAKYRPEDAFDFAFDDVVIRHYSEYDKLLSRARSGEVTDSEKELLELLFGANIPEDKISFGNIAGVAPVVDFNIELLTKALQKAGIEFKQNSTDRVGKVKNWIEEYNPNKKYVLLDGKNQEYFESLSEEEKKIIKTLHDYISSQNFTEKEIQLYLYSVINDESLSKKENVSRQQQNFKNIYNLLFGRDDGPRLYLFLSAVDKAKYLDLLNF